MTSEIPHPIGGLEVSEDRRSFLGRISEFSSDEQELIMTAYDTAKYGHHLQVRDSGIRYFEHPREVTLIALDELGIKDPKTIIELLIHDVFEDSAILGNAKYQTYEDNKKTALFRMSRIFGSDVARDVIVLSKPKGIDIGDDDREEVEEMYRENLKQVSVRALLVKACDRLHNLRTLGECSDEKKRRKVAETREFYFPLFQKLFRKYPKEAEYLLGEMEKAINLLNL